MYVKQPYTLFNDNANLQLHISPYHVTVQQTNENADTMAILSAINVDIHH